MDTVCVCESFYYDGDPCDAAPCPEKENGTPAAADFYDSCRHDARRLNNVTTWIDTIIGIDQALEAGDYSGTGGVIDGSSLSSGNFQLST